MKVKVTLRFLALIAGSQEQQSSNRVCHSLRKGQFLGGGGVLCIFWIRGRTIRKGIDFHDFGIRNGIDFRDSGIRNGIDFCSFRNW